MSNALEDHLQQFLTANRLATFENVLNLRTRHLTVVLEDFFQPHNASACLRSCDCFGIQDAHIIENRHEFRPTHSISAGAVDWLTLHHYADGTPNTVSCLNTLKDRGYQVVAAEVSADDCPLDEFDISKPTAILFGTEQQGISEQARQNVDGFLRIPMFGFTESFNVSVACALILSHLSTRLHRSNFNWQLASSERDEILKSWTRKSIGYRWPELELEFFRRYPEYAEFADSWSQKIPPKK